MRASSPARADSMMTGKSRRSGSFRIATSKPKPSSPGIMASVTTRSGRFRRIASIAAFPSSAVSTSQWAPSNLPM